MRTRIKICGVTSVEIACHAIQCGADAIGLNFYPGSSRYLEPDQAIPINNACAPFVSRVGVFANPDPEFVHNVIQQVTLDYLQFHGDETPEFCGSFELPYIKAIRVGESTEPGKIAGQFPGAVAILLDSYVEESYGGTGEAFNWARARIGGAAPIILAGGLDPENVRSAISVAAPFAVDVSSGVETNGIKDAEKIRVFCQNALF